MQDLGAPQHPQPLDRYFALSDTAGRSEDDFEELIALFAPDARIEPASGPAVQGTTAIREFFHDFFARNVETRHLWLTRPRQDAPGDGDAGTHGGGVVVDWAVAVRRSSGELIALAGTDTADLTPDGRITRLRVVMRA